MADLALAREQRLRARERQQHGGAVAAGAVVVDDRGHRSRRAGDAGEHAHAVAGARVELLGRVAVEVDLAGPRSASVTVRPSVRRIAPKPAMCAGSGAYSETRASVWRLRASCSATGAMIAGATPSTSPVARSARSTAANRRCGEELGLARPRRRGRRPARRSARATG